ncbi:single-stranded DNA-binding protein [Streptomyces agglomeratus]|uniref:single-stranded DNA-binding protein n=1 Tax=Streptomyces agglomeratus TaxID=285458 RepID=UPI00099F5A2A|nr:single-stranded DNA-binding protein [Streptomyces agglomeratus]
MSDTWVALAGNAATAVDYRDSVTGGVARFRLAVTARYWDRQNETWADGHSSFYTVWARRSLAANLAASVSIGEPLLVHGRLRVRDEEKNGQRRFSADIEALSVGHDMTRGTSAFRRVVKGDPALARRPVTEGHNSADSYGDLSTQSARRGDGG